MLKAQYLGFLNTPPLWYGEVHHIRQFEFPAITLDAFRPKAIPPKMRLGHQIEHVFQQLITHTTDFEILLYNLPVRNNKITLGEIDFILRDKKSRELLHVELAYKFYIIDPGIEEPIRQLIGPNRRDSFFDKMEKINKRQFPLLHTEEGASALIDKNIDHLQINHRSCFKAQIFRPYGTPDINIGDLNIDCLVGYWIRFEAFSNSEFSNAQYYVPSKSEWIIEPHEDISWKLHPVIIQDIRPKLGDNYAPMLWKKNTNNIIEKIFVVWW